jgi:CubicO group peptidase (beta-lactamase class C family)
MDADPIFLSALSVWDRAHRGGVAAGVIRNGEVIFRGEVGFANIEHSVRVDRATRFQIASLSKQFLAALALLLSDEGRIELDADVRGRSRQLKGYPAPISLRQLLSHTSGLLDTFDIMTLAGAKVETPVRKETIDELFAAQRHLNFPTGQGFAYSNGGFEVAATLLEETMGLPLTNLYDRYVFGPTGMTRSVLVNRDTTVTEGKATGYLVHEGQVRRGAHGIPFNGGAGVLSTLDDMLLWERRLLDDLSPGSLLSRMETPPRFSGGAASVYGLGTYVDRWRGLPISGHGGLLPGFVAQVVRCSIERTSVVVLSNSSDVDSNGLARGLLRTALADKGEELGQDVDIEPGRYFDAAKNEQFEVRREGSRTVALTHGWRVPLLLDADQSIIFDDPLLDWRVRGPDRFELVEWGKNWGLRRISPGSDLSAGLDGFEGDFGRDEIPTRLRFARADWVLVLNIDGAFGRASYPLERIGDDIFLGRSPADVWMPFEMIIQFVGAEAGPAQSVRITTDRTKGIVFRRHAAP